MDKETRKQLREFAEENGPRLWKVRLRQYWSRGLPVPGYPELYWLRNHASYGFKWLANLTFEDATGTTDQDPPTKKNRVTVFIEGGVVQHVEADDPTIKVIIVDYDTEGAGEPSEWEPTLTTVEQDNGAPPAKAYLTDSHVAAAGTMTDNADKALTAMAERNEKNGW